MLENLDSTLLARIQFAFTISFHIVFPAFTIGLASWLAVLEWRWLKTGNQVYADVYRMWVKIFAVTFGMGVVSGVVMSFQFGTNWSRFSDFISRGDAVRLEPCQSQDAFCRNGHCRGRDLDFGVLDFVGQQLDADPPGVPRGPGWFAVSH